MSNSLMWLIRKSKKVTCVNNSSKGEQVSLPEPKKQMQEMEDDDKDIFTKSIHD